MGEAGGGASILGGPCPGWGLWFVLCHDADGAEGRFRDWMCGAFQGGGVNLAYESAEACGVDSGRGTCVLCLWGHSGLDCVAICVAVDKIVPV